MQQNTMGRLNNTRYEEEDLNYTFIQNSLQKVNLDHLIQIFDVSNNYKHDDWEDWFNKLKVDLIRSSPSNVLIACRELTVLEDVIKELFKPSFAIVWS